MRHKDGFKLRKMCGENIITGEGLENINFNKLISLNDTAAFLWEELEGKEYTVDDMVALLLQKYQIDDQTARKDSEKLAEAWIEAGIAQ